MTSEERPATPYARMSADALKRAWERTILGMVYELPKLDRWERRDRPDFAIWTPGSDQAVGVEVTQIFPTESHARLRFMDGYMESLWQGDPHRHRDDVTALRVARVSIHSRDGVLKGEDVPVIMTESATDEDRRRALYEAVRVKDAKGYPFHDYRHINLVVFDWFDLEFEASEYSTDQFCGPELKELLRRCAFNEIFFVLEDTKSRGVESRKCKPRYVFLRLMELFLASEYFLAGSAIAQSEFAREVDGPEHLARLIGVHLARARGTGTIVCERGALCVQLGGSAVGLTTDGGLNILQFADSPAADHVQAVNLDDRLPASVAEEVDAFVDSHGFVWGYSDDVVEMPPTGEPVAKTVLVSEVSADAQ